MQMIKFFFTFFLLINSQPILAGLVWLGVAIPPSEVTRLKADPEYVEKVFESSPDDKSVGLDKAWHGIHFLLTGSGGPTESLSSKVIFGGESFGVDLGNGQAQLLTPIEVKKIAELLQIETPEKLASRYVPLALENAKIYPTIIWVREGQEALSYVLDYYKKLVVFYQRAAARGDAVIFVVQ
jgi:Domain of unknown function (DUF1877)